MKEKLPGLVNKKNFFIVFFSLQTLIITNMTYSGLRMYNFIRNGRQLVDQTMLFERDIGSDKDILVLGDSLSYGVGTSSASSSFAGQLAENFPDYNIINRSVVGYTTKNLAEDVESLLQDDQYDMIFVMIGGNDIFRYATDMSEAAKNMLIIADALSAQSSQAYVITTPDFRNISLIPWFTRPYYSDRSEKLHNAAIAIDAAIDNVTYINTYDFDPDAYKNLEAADGFHLNDLGITRLVDIIVATQQKNENDSI